MVSHPPLPRGVHERGYLPHWDFGGGVQAITYRLADSLPAAALERLSTDLPPDRDGRPDQSELRRRIEARLDAGHGSCLLAHPDAAQAVIAHWRHRDGQDYDLIAWVVMPNHVHVCLAIAPGRSLSTIVEAWKSCSSRSIRRALGGSGTVWQADYWDRWIRDHAHLSAAIGYIVRNPVAAGLVEHTEHWRWSSAYEAGEGARAPG